MEKKLPDMIKEYDTSATTESHQLSLRKIETDKVLEESVITVEFPDTITLKHGVLGMSFNDIETSLSNGMEAYVYISNDNETHLHIDYTTLRRGKHISVIEKKNTAREIFRFETRRNGKVILNFTSTERHFAIQEVMPE